MDLELYNKNEQNGHACVPVLSAFFCLYLRLKSSASRSVTRRLSINFSRVASWQLTPGTSSTQPIHHLPDFLTTAVYVPFIFVRPTNIGFSKGYTNDTPIRGALQNMNRRVCVPVLLVGICVKIVFDSLGVSAVQLLCWFSWRSWRFNY